MQVRVAIVTEMSDTAISDEASCAALGFSWHRDVGSAIGTCYSKVDEYQAPVAVGLAAIEHFNRRLGRYVPRFGQLSGCDKLLSVSTIDR